MTALQRKILSTVLWAPITWIPVTVASFGAIMLNFPWWVNVVTYSLAIAGPSVMWAAQVPRLAELWKVEMTDRQIRTKLGQEESLLRDARQCGFALGYDTLAKAYRIERELESLYKEKSWLAQFSFLTDAIALVNDLELSVSDTLKEMPADAKNRAEFLKAREEVHHNPYTTGIRALEDTLQTCRHTLESTDASLLDDPAQRARSAAVDILERNKAARKAVRHLNEDQQENA